MIIEKDKSLDSLAELGNVAQFVSYAPTGPDLTQRYSRVWGVPPNHIFNSVEAGAAALLAASPEKTINVRSFTPESPRSREFVYGIPDLDTAVRTIHRLAGEGLFVIANETVNISDGGVSGVVQGEVIEFAPDDTPRCVEKPGVTSLPRPLGLSILKTVYGFAPEVHSKMCGRLEFSIHPSPRGWRRSHTILWEYEDTEADATRPGMTWPNRFSRHLGDKAFGLLVADAAGFPVPRTTVIGRRVAPFTFGRPTDSSEVWTRTAPVEPEPGLYTTVKGWIDPFKLLAIEDQHGTSLMSVISQAAVPAIYSGAALVMGNGELLIEGHSGEGDNLMLGKIVPEALPESVVRDVNRMFLDLEKVFGPVRFEWVHDGNHPWIVQLHSGQTQSLPEIIYPGEPDHWITFEAKEGLEALRRTLLNMPPEAGVTVVGEIGLTSHLADLVRKSKRPTRVVKQLSFAWT
ncbi:hypothetical protein [Rhizobium leguminosarum]|uniref:hypothetical protein n=1 Tax=Rhizobium leguminosarum TaxID=384 RepID=UPI003F9A3E35